MKTYAYGLPRLGKNREFKKAVESFWKENLGEKQLWSILDEIQKNNNAQYNDADIDSAPDGEMTFYDFMFDTAIMCGLFNPNGLNEYYSFCRGASAMEMTKWFNTNYHYLVTDFSALGSVRFCLNFEHFALRFKQNKFPSVVGPFTFLKLSKGISPEKFKVMFLELIDVYAELLAKVEKIHIEEPAFVLDLSKEEVDMIIEGYNRLAAHGSKISLAVYYGAVDWMDRLVDLPVGAISLDFVRGPENYEYICEKGFPEGKTLIAGLVDGRNVWRNDIAASVEKLNCLSKKVKKLAVSNAGPLFHLPFSLEGEVKMDKRLKQRLAFAREKLEEIALIAGCFAGKPILPRSECGSYGENKAVQERVRSLRSADFVKSTPLAARRAKHDEILRLPLFPTTTIGSYPQTSEVRKKRAAFRKGIISAAEYKKYIRGEIDKLIVFQEDMGLDVLVHGEYERTDMVEFFAEKLDGIATTESGWIISYGTRIYRPPIVFGDVSRPQPMTLDEIVYAQSRTKKPVKGMLTGAVTIIAWSFCREDIPLSEVSFQIGLSLKEEITDYEKAGIRIVQVDEAAFREKAPIKKKNWPEYFSWAVQSFNLTTNTDPATQIHTHMCYSEFGEIIGYINQMDFDVISIEASRSNGDIIGFFENIDFKRQIGLGVWDIHSPAVPPVDEIIGIVQRALRMIPKENFWVNPDCGLKTREWPETKESLKNLVEASNQLRQHRE